MADPPQAAAWRHRGARHGFESAFFTPRDDGWRIRGCTAAVEDGRVWTVEYAIVVDATWATQSARIRGRSTAGLRTVELESASPAAWRVDGVRAPQLDGCLDVDLESSALTNAFPVRRLGMAVGDKADAPAVYVRALDLTVELLEQRYERIPDENGHEQYEYAAPAFDFECRLTYDRGLVRTYPGIAERMPSAP